MAEYIERSKAENELDEWFDMYPDSDTAREALTLAKRSIKKLPAADVRPVVLCRDCIHFKPQHKSARWSNATPMCSRSATIKMPPDGFCSFGAKREES